MSLKECVRERVPSISLSKYYQDRRNSAWALESPTALHNLEGAQVSGG